MNIAEAQQISNTVPTFSSGRKLSKSLQACLWELLQNEPECPTSLLLIKLERRFMEKFRSASGMSTGFVQHGDSAGKRAARGMRKPQNPAAGRVLFV